MAAVRGGRITVSLCAFPRVVATAAHPECVSAPRAHPRPMRQHETAAEQFRVIQHTIALRQHLLDLGRAWVAQVRDLIQGDERGRAGSVLISGLICQLNATIRADPLPPRRPYPPPVIPVDMVDPKSMPPQAEVAYLQPERQFRDTEKRATGTFRLPPRRPQHF